MNKNETICPVIDSEIEDILFEKMQPILDFLQKNEALPDSDLAFPIGTVTHDGRLDLCKQNLGIEGAAMIVDALQINQNVKHLLLGTNKIGNEGAKFLSEIIRQNTALQTLYLGCNNIEAEGAIAICEALEENTDIKSLWFKRNPIGEKSVAALIHLLQKNKNIRTLDLVNTCLEDGFYALFDYFQANKSVERLYLSGNYLKAAHLESIGELLAKNKTLRALFVSVNLFGDEGAQNLAKGLAQNDTLQELSIASCGIGGDGFVAIFKALEGNKNLKYLDLSYTPSTKVLKSEANEMTNEAAEKLLFLLQKLPNLKYINLTKTRLSAEYKAVFSNFQEKNIIFEGINTKNTFEAHQDSKAIKSVYR